MRREFWISICFSALVALAGCAGGGGGTSSGDCVDLDGDGYGEGLDCTGPDCNDADPAQNVSCEAPRDCTDPDGDFYGEGPDCLGPDCDENDPSKHEGCDCTDRDGDGYGLGPDCRGIDCEGNSGDNDPNINPGAPEIPANGKDDDCRGGDFNCVDMDGDGYGEGPDCLGPDCDDSDRNVRPGGVELCGNGKDDDCGGNGDEVCTCENDADGDGHGEGGSCAGMDCNDNDPTVNESATEVCNGKDDDCDGMTDECENAGQACDVNAGICKTAAGQPCQAADECVSNTVCQDSVCKGQSGIACQGNTDCALGFLCEDSMCAVDPNYDPCDDLTCSGDTPECLREDARCVECLTWFDCEIDFGCAAYTCQPGVDASVLSDPNVEMTQIIANAYNNTSDDSIELFAFLDSEGFTINKSAVSNFVCDTSDEDLEGMLANGERDRQAAEAVFGCGLFNDEDIVWDEPIPNTNFFEWCIWTLPPNGSLDDKDVVIKPCTDFPIE